MAHNRLMQTLLKGQNIYFVITYHFVYVGSFMGEENFKNLEKSTLHL